MKLQLSLFIWVLISLLYSVGGRKPWERTRFSSREKSDAFHGSSRDLVSAHDAIAFRTPGGGGLHTRRDAWQFTNRRSSGFHG
ncbi:hypothetical protein OESDEN_09566 [Oesophagostomum dentatum]|uniref:Secreted protein n=1 Tax=Oesophagostomum dentatum TaxID=61180 RepID=A0A0B1T483_OESDE|nr:hypothetical protein OESDEN_09566 [Oesophagostomum dentatum]